VDHEVFSKNRRTNKRLNITDEEIFYEKKPRFYLSSHDTHRVLMHVKQRQKKKPKP